LEINHHEEPGLHDKIMGTNFQAEFSWTGVLWVKQIDVFHLLKEVGTPSIVE
jgi:hypothetical protein